MRIIGLAILHNFGAAHADSRAWIRNWTDDVRAASWKTTQDVKRRYPTASFLANNVVIFNARGNTYRLETQIAFGVGIIAVKWMGTHAEYTRRNS